MALELVRVSVTPEEGKLLSCLEVLVLGRIARLAHPDSDVGVQARSLLARAREALKAFEGGNESSSKVSPLPDENWRFPDKSHLVLLNQAMHSWIAYQAVREKGRDRTAPVSGGDEGGGEHRGLSPDTGADAPNPSPCEFNEAEYEVLQELISLAFMADEIGGSYTWRWMLDALRQENEIEDDVYEGDGEGSIQDGENDSGVDDADRKMVKMLKAYLAASTCSSEAGSDFPDNGRHPRRASMGIDGEVRGAELEGSKLQAIATLLLQHKEWCDKNVIHFSAIIFVSTRMLASATADALVRMPRIGEFVVTESIVGLSEMSLSDQRMSLAHFRDGNANVLVSTSVCGEGIDVPACGLVICTALPNSGTALVQIRGRIRCDVNCR